MCILVFINCYAVIVWTCCCSGVFWMTMLSRIYWPSKIYIHIFGIIGVMFSSFTVTLCDCIYATLDIWSTLSSFVVTLCDGIVMIRTIIVLYWSRSVWLIQNIIILSHSAWLIKIIVHIVAVTLRDWFHWTHYKQVHHHSHLLQSPCVTKFMTLSANITGQMPTKLSSFILVESYSV